MWSGERSLQESSSGDPRVKNLLRHAIEDGSRIQRLRTALGPNPSDEDALALAEALAKAGCGHEAAPLLRGRKKIWSKLPWASEAEACLAATAWWNREGRDMAMARQRGEDDLALAILAGHKAYLWDHPPTLSHLVAIARRRGDLELYGHLVERMVHLCERGVARMSMKAFEYMAQADRIEVQALRGDPAGAVQAFLHLKPNTGNRMHYDLRLGELQVMAGDHSSAMRTMAKVLADAEQRSDYGRDVRLNWISDSERLEPLREREDWGVMMEDPKGYLRETVG